MPFVALTVRRKLRVDFHSGLDIDIIVFIFVIIETLALTLHAAGALEI